MYGRSGYQIFAQSTWLHRVMKSSNEHFSSAAKRALAKLTEHGEHPFYSYAIPDGMKDLKLFFESECRIQAAIAGNRTGKSAAKRQKEMCIAVGFDPRRPGYRYPFHVKNRQLLMWACCEPENVRDELRDLVKLIPKGIKYRAYWSRGDERIEFEPSELRPKGAIIKVKSYGMPRNEFQRDAVDVISFDEEPPEYIWVECQQRLLTTKGWTVISMTPVNGSVWLYEKLRQMKPEFRCLERGDFSWYSWSQYECPWIDRDELEKKAAELTEDEVLIRVRGVYHLLHGSAYFGTECLRIQYDRFSTKPTMSLTFSPKGTPFTEEWKDHAKGWKVWEEPVAFASYGIGADVGRGLGGDHDASTAVVINKMTGEVAATFHDNSIEPFDFGVELSFAGRYFNNAVVAHEVNFEGSAVLLALRDQAYPKIYLRETYGGQIQRREHSYGFLTSGPSKRAILQELSSALIRGGKDEYGGVIVRDADVLRELSNFGHLKKKTQGQHGLGALTGHDDRVMALAIAYQSLSQAPTGLPQGQKQFVRTHVQSMIDKAFEEKNNENSLEQEMPWYDESSF